MSLFEIILCIVLAPFAILATAVSVALLTGIGDGNRTYIRCGGVWRGFRNWEVWKVGVTGPVITVKDGGNG